MNLLLDTHALLWFLEDAPQLSPIARTAIMDKQTQCYVSDASVWEMAIKLTIKKLRLPLPFADLFPGKILMLGFRILPIRTEHLHYLMELPLHHRDPFDRLLIAQAKAEALTLVSQDQHFPAYDVSLLW